MAEVVAHMMMIIFRNDQQRWYIGETKQQHQKEKMRGHLKNAKYINIRHRGVPHTNMKTPFFSRQA